MLLKPVEIKPREHRLVYQIKHRIALAYGSNLDKAAALRGLFDRNPHRSSLVFNADVTSYISGNDATMPCITSCSPLEHKPQTLSATDSPTLFVL